MRDLKQAVIEELKDYIVDPTKAISEYEDDVFHYNSGLKTAIQVIEELLTADAVEVVRCKDCKHRPTGTGANHDLEFPDDECPCQCAGDYWYSWMPPDDWFCPCGKKKENEDERSD